jgi:hypothetical protein
MLVAFRCLLIICYPRGYSVHVTIENRAVLQSPETEHGLHLGSDDNNLDTFSKFDVSTLSYVAYTGSRVHCEHGF